MSLTHTIKDDQGNVVTILDPDGSMTLAPVIQPPPPPPPTPAFSLSAGPLTQLAPGASEAFTVTVVPSGGFNSPVTLSVSGLPANVTAAVNNNPATGGSSTITVTAGASAAAGTVTFTVSGTSGSLSASTPVSFSISTVVPPPPPPPPVTTGEAGTLMGIGVEQLNDYNPSLPFANLMDSARAPGTVTTPWISGGVPLDANGWPTADFGVYFVSMTGDPLNRPVSQTRPSLAGTYTLQCQGQCTVTSSDLASKIQNLAYNSATNTTTAQLVVGPTATVIGLLFQGTKTGVQNIYLMQPGCAVGTMFAPNFLNAIAPYACIRLMDWSEVNTSTVSQWSQRTLTTAVTQQNPNGVAHEREIALANDTGKDIWINIPTSAGLPYWTALATLIKNTLNPGLHVYIEYSNEWWNTGVFDPPPGLNAYQQNYNAAQLAVTAAKLDFDVAAGQPPNLYYRAYRYAAFQTMQIAQAFEAVFGSAAMNNTIRVVYMSQFAGPGIAMDGMYYLQSQFGVAPSSLIYGIGSAPYFPESVQGGVFQTEAADMAAIQASIPAIVTQFSGAAYPHPPPVFNSATYSVTYAAIAAYYGLKNMVYEFNANPTDQNTDKTLNELLRSDPNLGAAITQVMKAWFANANNGLICFYQVASPCGDSWGAQWDLTVPTPSSEALATMSGTSITSLQ